MNGVEDPRVAAALTRRTAWAPESGRSKKQRNIWKDATRAYLYILEDALDDAKHGHKNHMQDLLRNGCHLEFDIVLRIGVNSILLFYSRHWFPISAGLFVGSSRSAHWSWAIPKQWVSESSWQPPPANDQLCFSHTHISYLGNDAFFAPPEAVHVIGLLGEG